MARKYKNVQQNESLPTIANNIEKRVNDDLPDVDIRSMYHGSEGTELNEAAATLLQACLLKGDENALYKLDSYLIGFFIHGVPIDKIAESLNISIGAAKHLMDDLKKRHARQTEKLEITSVLGETLMRFDELSRQGFRLLNQATTKPIHKVQLIEKLSNLEMNKYKILDTNRFYESRGFKPAEKTINVYDNPQLMVNMIQNIYSGNDVAEDDLFKNALEAEYQEVTLNSVEEDNDETPIQ